jgi:pimeloyl-ACP methyl ester carboxylesterase/DNA-binding CsgD family transcriptional regulator
MRSRVQFVRSADGVNIAWTASGVGDRSIVLLPNHIGSIEDDDENPFRGPLIKALATRFRVVRYDQRGFGLGTRGSVEHGLERWCEDLAAVLDAACAVAPAVLFVISQGAPTAAVYAARHPERVAALVVYGAMPCGVRAGGDAERTALHEAKTEVIRRGWSGDNPGARLYVTTELISDPTPEELAWFDRHFADSARADAVASYLEAVRDVDARPQLPSIRCPTLVVQTDGDQLVRREVGRAFAQAIPGAQYAELHGKSHMTRGTDGTRAALLRHIMEFLQGEEKPATFLSAREQEILQAVCAGLTNEIIARKLGISDKTVRNHLSRVFVKLGVSSRTQAAIAALSLGIAAPRDPHKLPIPPHSRQS